MAARVMGIYATREGIAVAVSSGNKPLHSSWHPAFVQPDGTYLYPAEEIHRLTSSLSPDATVLYDADASVIPLSVSLPRLKPQQLFQALKIELSSRGIDEILSPAVGFCPARGTRTGGKKAGISGFALVMDSDILQEIEGKYRPLGVVPSIITIPILPLAFAFLREKGEETAILFLTEGDLSMIAVAHEGEVKRLEVFIGDGPTLVERLRSQFSEFPDAALYGFRAQTSGRGRHPVPEQKLLFRPIEAGENLDRAVQEGRPLSREDLALLLARLPNYIGTLEYGGVRTKVPQGEPRESPKLIAYASAWLVLVLIGVGSLFGVKGWTDRKIYESQKRIMTRLVKSVLPNAPPVVSLSLIQSQFKKVERQRKHLSVFLEPTVLTLPAEVLPALDRMGEWGLREVSGTKDTLRIVLESKNPFDPKRFRERLGKAVKGTVEIAEMKGGLSKGKVYSVVVKRAKRKGEGSRAE